MSLLRQLALGGVPPVYTVEDVFSALTYTGTYATLNIVNGIDLAGKGGMVWGQVRNFSYGGMLADSVSGVTGRKLLFNTGAQSTFGDISSFNANGFTLGASLDQLNHSGGNFASWSFAQAPKFFKVAQVVVSGSDQTINLSNLGTVGMVVVKRNDGAGGWYTLHRSGTSGWLTFLNTSAAETPNGAITLSGTTLTLVQSVIGNGTFSIYAWAHDTTSTGMIQCGSFSYGTGPLGAGVPEVNLGWEPQYILMRRLDAVGDWKILDTSRNLNAVWNDYNSKLLITNGTVGEVGDAEPYITSTGFGFGGITNPSTYIYMAIRKGPMKKPTVGAQVFSAINRVGSGTTDAINGVGFSPDIVISIPRLAGYGPTVYDRSRGVLARLQMNATAAEVADTDSLMSFIQDGVTVGADTSWGSINAVITSIDYFIRRYPYVVDEIMYIGTSANATQPHGLISAPELWLIKNRGSTNPWSVGSSQLAANEYLVLNTTAAKATSASRWNNTYPTVSVLNLGTDSPVNGIGSSYVAFLFATLAGISKVGSYTGNGGSQTINCGFTTGARFVLIKRTDAAGDWYVWDTVRGIISANDPHLSLNGTAAEVTTDDSIDPDSTGFIVNQLAATNINVTSATYIYLALA